jgi:tetratricopeptide (TPR) repeat protein
MPVMQRLGNLRNPNAAAVKELDSLYALDSNSMFLKGIMLEVNRRLIYDSLYTERIPQTIVILEDLGRMQNTDEHLFNVMQMYRLAGNYDAAAAIARQLLLSPDDRQHDDGVSNLILVYMADGNHEKALAQVKSTPYKLQNARQASYLAKVYYNNKLYDSALHYADYSIAAEPPGSKKYYSDYVIKAKIAFEKGDKTQSCHNIKVAEEIVSKENAEKILKTRDQENRFIKELLADIEEIHTLRKKYCK